MTHFRHAAIVAAVLAGGGIAQAQTTVIIREPVETQTIVREPVETQTIVTERPLVLAPAQRQKIYRTIVRERVRPAAPSREYRVGTRVPQSVELFAVPDPVAYEVPAVRSYKYMVVNGRIVLVDPVTSEVVAELVD
jgi:Protein of unknown function (DUF1236)